MVTEALRHGIENRIYGSTKALKHGRKKLSSESLLTVNASVANGASILTRVIVDRVLVEPSVDTAESRPL